MTTKTGATWPMKAPAANMGNASKYHERLGRYFSMPPFYAAVATRSISSRIVHWWSVSPDATAGVVFSVM